MPRDNRMTIKSQLLFKIDARRQDSFKMLRAIRHLKVTRPKCGVPKREEISNLSNPILARS
jgi:predicted XRE-type DNA-binding protein